MGGTLANISKGQQSLQSVSPNSNVPLFGAPPAVKPSLGSQIAQGAVQSGLSGLSQATAQPQSPASPGAMPSPAPAPAPVDPSFFSPTNFGGGMGRAGGFGGMMMGRNPNAFYGGR